MPPSVFPVNSVKAMRACLRAGRRRQAGGVRPRGLRAYWSEDRDISQDAVLADICGGHRHRPRLVFAGIATQPVKDTLKANTEELIRRGGFGSPTIFVGADDMYFGNDRLPLVREALQRRAAA